MKVSDILGFQLRYSLNYIQYLQVYVDEVILSSLAWVTVDFHKQKQLQQEV